MKSTLLLLVSAAIAIAGFIPNVRIDHEFRPTDRCERPAITLGPGNWSGQPLYVAFENDSTEGIAVIRSDIMFQKSTDAGRTWLPADVLVRRGEYHAINPDITTDPDGNIYVVYTQDIGSTRQTSCVQSIDGGVTWSQPTRVDDHATSYLGGVRIAADWAGNLLCAWNDNRTGRLHIWSSVSTDRGATWNQNVRVDDDTTDSDCYQADVFVQPVTNHFLVAAEAPHHNHLGSFLYRSTDGGQTYQPGVRLDTFTRANASSPHVVADAQHVICGYTAGLTEARTLYTQSDTWGAPRFIGYSYYGPALAISAGGRVHAALMGHRDTAEISLTYYACSSDHGVSWSEPELVNDDTTTETWYPDIAADSAGNAYIAWQHDPGARAEIWFSTNSPAAIAEQPAQQPIGVRPFATVVSNVLMLGAVGSRQNAEYKADLLTIAGRKIMVLTPGANDVSALAPGVYFIREGLGIRGEGPGKMQKVVVTR